MDQMQLIQLIMPLVAVFGAGVGACWAVRRFIDWRLDRRYAGISQLSDASFDHPGALAGAVADFKAIEEMLEARTEELAVETLTRADLESRYRQLEEDYTAVTFDRGVFAAVLKLIVLVVGQLGWLARPEYVAAIKKVRAISMARILQNVAFETFKSRHPERTLAHLDVYVRTGFLIDLKGSIPLPPELPRTPQQALLAEEAVIDMLIQDALPKYEHAPALNEFEAIMSEIAGSPDLGDSGGPADKSGQEQH